MAKKYIDAELIKSARVLYFDIDACITELIRARIEHNEENEGKALFRMEGLMVATMQQLDCIIDTLQQEQSCDTCTNDKGCVTCKDGELWEGKEQPSEDLEKELDKFYGMYRKDGKTYDITSDEEVSDWKENGNFLFEIELARHFYELGKNSK